MENKKTLTWHDIKEMANSLTEEQLLMPVRYWTEGDGGNIDTAFPLPEDYIRSEGEDYLPESEAPPELKYDEDVETMPKGTPMLWIL